MWPSAGDNNHRASVAGVVVDISFSPGGTSLTVISWLEQILQTNLVVILGLFFPSYGKSVKGAGQDRGSSSPADSYFLEVSFTSRG